jgi:hypothetical protein
MHVDLLTKEDLYRFKKELLRDLQLLLKEGDVAEEGEAEKLELSASVAQIALLVRAAIDAGLITNQNKTGVLRVVSELVSAQKAEHISVRSMQMKMYVAERATKEAVKGLLMEMYKRVVMY